MIDRELVTRKMVLIAKDIEALRALADTAPEALLAEAPVRRQDIAWLAMRPH